MRRRATSVVAIAALALGLAAAPCRADQFDPRLDDLFARLKTAPNLSASRKIETEIWGIWLQHPDAKVSEATQAGIGHMNAGEAEAAEADFTRAIERSPDYAEAWNKRATLRYFTGDFKGSVADCAQVLKLEPRHFGALSGLGMIHMAIEDWAGAARWFEEALKVNPHMPGVAASLAEARRRALGRET